MPAPIQERIQSTNATATIEGTFLRPRLEVRIQPGAKCLRSPSRGIAEHLKSLGLCVWNGSAWMVHSLGTLQPSVCLANIGIDVLPHGDLGGVDGLACPVGVLDRRKRTVLVSPRLAGFDLTRKLVGLGAIWDKERGFFRTDVGDVLKNGQVREGIIWSDEAITRAFEVHSADPRNDRHFSTAATLATAPDTSRVEKNVLERVGALPTFDRRPFEYQLAGAYAIAAGRRCLFDEPGVGKTFQALIALRLMNAQKTIIVCPPLLLTNWGHEAIMAGFKAESIAVFRSGRREPNIEDKSIIIVSDSLLASRKTTQRLLARWCADMMIVDEAHRLKTTGSKRSEAVLDIGSSIGSAPIALTGTPIFASPHELVPILELTRLVNPIFGGRAQFLEDFCYQDKFGRFRAKMAALPRLQKMLESYVWVRRKKQNVLTQLPPKIRRELPIEVSLKTYRDAHKEVLQKIRSWRNRFEEKHLRAPDVNDCEEYAAQFGFELISQLRRACGVAKIDTAKELITAHLQENPAVESVYQRPLIVWIHHKIVAARLIEVLQGTDIETAAITGNTPDITRDDIVDRFQQGKIAVLVASITKAGVGITLTRSSDALFVETDWTPALITQAEDRTHRIGTVNPSCYTTLVAKNTLDEPIHRVLSEKMKVLEKALGIEQTSANAVPQSDTLKDITLSLMREAQKK